MAVKSIEIDGAKWNVIDQGEGEIILLIHGFPLDHTMWSGQIEDLSSEFRIIAPDLAGFGKSELHERQKSDARDQTTIRQMADEVAMLLDKLGVDEPVTYCGLSMGGYIGWEFFRHYRDKIRRLIAVDTRAVADEPQVVRGRATVAKLVLEKGSRQLVRPMSRRLFSMATLANRRELAQSARDTIAACDPRAAAAGSYAMGSRADSSDLLQSIDCPTLVVVGELDVISTPEEMKGIADAIPGAVFETIIDAGHLAPMERPVIFNEIVRKFMART
ncbi:MAG: alpha/beta hydrolase [Planctomycetota bacterium]